MNLPATPNYTANALNQYTAIGAIVPAYDTDGNATSYPLPVAATVNSTLVWDAENRLIEVKNASSVSLVAYQYDYLGRRTLKNVTVAGGGTGSNVTFVYDGWNPIVEYTGTTLSKSYTWGMDLSGSMQGAGGVGGLLAVKDGTSTYYPTFDGNGNVSEYLDSTGVVQAHYEYDAFGNTLVSSGAKVNDFAHRFSTKPLDAETGLYYYGYRYYDPVTGRWPSRDPIGERGGVNLYGFIGNNATNGIDLLGWIPISNIWDQDENSDGIPDWTQPVEGTELPGTGGLKNGNCIGSACGINDYIQPTEEELKPLQVKRKAKDLGENLDNFLNGWNPMGEKGKCRKVSCNYFSKGNSMTETPCKGEEREVVVVVFYTKKGQFEFHGIGRACPKMSTFSSN